MGKSIFDFIPYIAEAVATVTGQGEWAIPAIEGIKSGVKTGNPLSGVLAAGGSALGSSILGGAGGILGETPANALGSEIGGSAVGGMAPFGSFAGNVLGSDTIGSMVGSQLGSSLGESAGQTLNPPSSSTPSLTPPPFQASMSPQMGLPQSLSQFSDQSPFQQGTNIATKGVYGGGNGPEETNYFMNLMNRQLFDKNGQEATDTSSINPVQMGYLNQLGVSGSSPDQILQGISRYGT